MLSVLPSPLLNKTGWRELCDSSRATLPTQLRKERHSKVMPYVLQMVLFLPIGHLITRIEQLQQYFSFLSHLNIHSTSSLVWIIEN